MKDILIRGVTDEDHHWLESNRPEGVSQQEFLESILTDARINSRQFGLFEKAIPPKLIHAKVPFKFIDLFAGIGGFRSALTPLGGQCVFTSEWDKYAAKTYQAWYGDKDIYTGDIREIASSKIPDHDILCAGFPCQPFSLAGVSKKNSLGHKHGFHDEKQGNLFFKIMEIVSEKRPPILFLENVKNLKSHDKGNTWKVIETNLISHDYVVFEKIIDAQSWVPQHRERIFIVCFDKHIFGPKDQVDFKFPTPPNNGDCLRLGSVLSGDEPDRKYMLSDKLWKYLQDYRKKHEEKGNGFGYSLFGPDDIARTMSARYHKDGSEILIRQPKWKNPRRLTPHEAMHLMGFDERYSGIFGHEDGFPQVCSDTQAYRQFGNAVSPKVVESIGKQIIDVMVELLSQPSQTCLLKGRAVIRH
jgi:DNA (cytosine-5)-methyltransferase 1